MSNAENSSHFWVCKFCSHPIPLSTSEEPDSIDCSRCGLTNHKRELRSARVTFGFSLTALIFMVPANLFPFMTIELYGNVHSSTIWGGVVSLADSGSMPIAVVVFLASILIPILKLVILFYLSLTARNQKNQKFKVRLYHVVEAIGRWSMLDIFLLAVLVAMMKLGAWTTVEPEIGSLLFAVVVLFTMLASASFDPKILWETQNGKSSSAQS